MAKTLIKKVVTITCTAASLMTGVRSAWRLTLRMDGWIDELMDGLMDEWWKQTNWVHWPMMGGWMDGGTTVFCMRVANYPSLVIWTSQPIIRLQYSIEQPMPIWEPLLMDTHDHAIDFVMDPCPCLLAPSRLGLARSLTTVAADIPYVLSREQKAF